MVGHLVSNLEKEKATPISPYLFHLYNRNECLREGEIEELVVAKKYLEFGLCSEIVPDLVELYSDRRSLSPREQHKGSPSSQRKSTYRSPDEKSPVRNLDWRTISMGSFDFEEDPFRRVKEELEVLQGQYSKMEVGTREASKLLGDYKAGNIYKELKKLKQEDNSELKTYNTQLKL